MENKFEIGDLVIDHMREGIVFTVTYYDDDFDNDFNHVGYLYELVNVEEEIKYSQYEEDLSYHKPYNRENQLSRLLDE